MHKNDVIYLISLQNCHRIRQHQLKIGQQVKIKQKNESIHRGYRIQFTEEVFTITTVQTFNPPTYTIEDANNQLIQSKFYEAELTRCEP